MQLQISGTHKFTMGKNRALAASVLLMAMDVFAFCASSSFSSAAGETQSLRHSWNTSHCFFSRMPRSGYIDRDWCNCPPLPAKGLAISVTGLQPIHPQPRRLREAPCKPQSPDLISFCATVSIAADLKCRMCVGWHLLLRHGESHPEWVTCVPVVGKCSAVE